MVDRRIGPALILALVVACASTQRPLELVESQPVDTTLDTALRDAYVVWPEQIAAAKHTLDFAEFYASNAPASRLEPIVRAIEAAIARGVKVRFLAEISFVREYADTLDRLQRAGAQVRTLDLSTTTGGILHAKYFVVDGRVAYLGSQNFDWRSLEHIEELGALIREKSVVSQLASVFEMDWARAGGTNMAPTRNRSEHFPNNAAGNCSEQFPNNAAGDCSEHVSKVALVASPKDLLPAGVAWDLPALVSMVRGARRSIRLQAMTYKSDEWRELEDLLIEAAKRGVKVEVLLADWSKREKTLPSIRQLARVPNVEVRFVTIPQHASGFIPFARVIHAKLIVVDDKQAWVGTSNFEREYFYESRNVGLVIDDSGYATTLRAWSDRTWRSSYATRVDPDAAYEPPRIK